MNPLEKYFTDDEKELLLLIHYFRKKYEDAKIKQGKLHPDDYEILKQLAHYEELVISYAQRRKDSDEKEKQRELVSICPQCGSEKARIAIGEAETETGYVCNEYHCDECGNEYLDWVPNNGKDQRKWYLSFLELVESLKDDIASFPEEQQKLFSGLRERGESFLKACDTEEEALRKLKEAEDQRDASTADMRDYLYLAKLKNQWPDLKKWES